MAAHWVVLDDVHWGDDCSIEAIEHLVRHPTRTRVLVIAVRCRSSRHCSWRAIWYAAVDGTADIFTLVPLTAEQAQTLMPAQPPAARREAICEARGKRQPLPRDCLCPRPLRFADGRED
ncbi:hypothetical protein AB0M36_37190 [Actinoplanes sp. NPDC051346]|uniref:hypothetical protein n=1 Tax=Actinoplanes sp. NPDC051346 TaxID=3155048 RepID=UPI00343B721A